MRSFTLTSLKSILVGSLIAAPAVPALAGGPQPAAGTTIAAVAGAFEQLGAPASLVAALAEEDDPARLYPYVRPAGDLDGDRAGDVVLLTRDAEAETLVITARRGKDGSELFTRDLGTDGVVTLLAPGPVGPNGSAGVLLGIYEFLAMGGSTGGTGATMAEYGERPFSYQTVGINVSLTVLALAGDGSVAWQRSFTDGRFLYTGLTLAVVQDLPILTGSLQSVPGAATDMTVAVYDRTPTVDNSQDDALQLQTIDGRDGSTVATRTVDIDNTEAPVAVAPDLDGDGLDDLTLQLVPAAGTTPVRSPTLVGLRGGDTAELWRSGSLPLSRETELMAAGDMTGDHIADFVLTRPLLRDEDDPARRVVLVDGRSGASLAGLDADTARPLGDVDRDGSAEVLVSSAFHFTNRVEVVHQAVDAAGGILWEQAFDVQGFSDPSATLLPSPGDVDGDGVGDLAHRLTVRRDSATTDVKEDARIVSGRTGQTLITEAPAAWALGGSLDGAGDDLATTSLFGASAVDVSALDGRSGQRMFTTRLYPRGDDTRQARVQGADLTGDGTLDLVVNIEGILDADPEDQAVSSADPAMVLDGYVINGRTGTVVWSTDAPRLPPQPDRVGKASADAPFTWSGTAATGLRRPVTVSPADRCVKDDPMARCEQVLVEIENPPAAGAASASRAATISIGDFGPTAEPATDLDIYVYESDQLGTLGPFVDASESAGEIEEPVGETVSLQVTTTREQPSRFYLVQVVYYRSVDSGYRGTVTLAGA